MKLYSFFIYKIAVIAVLFVLCAPQTTQAADTRCELTSALECGANKLMHGIDGEGQAICHDVRTVSAYLKEDGSCGSTRFTCSSGVINTGYYTDTTTQYRWRCDGLNGGTNSGACTSNIPVDGVCGTTHYTCDSGTSNSSAFTDTASEYRWQCDGQHGGSDSDLCTEAKHTFTCGNTCYECTNTSDGSTFEGGNRQRNNPSNGQCSWKCGTTLSCTTFCPNGNCPLPN